MATFGDETTTVTVDPMNDWLFFYRRQGVVVSSFRFEPTRPWWAFGAQVMTRIPVKGDLACRIEMRGLDVSSSSLGECRDCSFLRVTGAWYTGVNVPRGYSSVRYAGSATFGDRVITLEGTFPYS